MAFSLGSSWTERIILASGLCGLIAYGFYLSYGNRPLRALSFEQGMLASAAEMMHNRGTGERSAPNLFGPAPARVPVRQRGAYSRIRLLRAFGTPRASSLGGVLPVA